jgi:hypothetical protein
VWLEGFAGFDEGFEAGEDAGPAVGGVGVRGVVLGPLAVPDGDFGGLGLRGLVARLATNGCYFSFQLRASSYQLSVVQGSSLGCGGAKSDEQRASRKGDFVQEGGVRG